MKDMIKNAGITFWLSAAAAVFALVGMILFAVTNSIQGYAVSGGGLGLAMIIIGFILSAGAAFVTAKFGNQHFVTAIVRVAAVVLLCVAFGVLLSDRVGLASSLLTWDSHNQVGWSAFNISIGSAVLTLISVILMIVCAFMGGKSKAAQAA